MKLWPSLFTACALLFLGSARLRAQEADNYVLGFDGPDTISGNDGAVVTADYFCTLSHSGPGVEGKDTDADGENDDIGSAQGWSVSVSATGARVVGVTIAGTDTEALFFNGFDQTELTPDPDRNEGDCDGRDNGAVSAIALAFRERRALPANATSTILKLTIEKTIVEGGTASIEYVDGCRGEGVAVENVVTQEGLPGPFTTETKTIACNVIQDCCSGRINFGFSERRISSDQVFDSGIADASGLCLALDGEVRASPNTESSVYFNISSNFGEEEEDLVQGWSFSLAYDSVEGTSSIVDATVANSAGAPEPDGLERGGFENTELALPDDNNGQAGAVSAMILSFRDPITLPPQGTESCLQLIVTGEDGALGRFRVQDGLQGSAEPVDNVATVAGLSAAVCNLDTAMVNVAFRPPPGKGPFSRGDANNDGRGDIADGIWIVQELFYQGPPSSCQSAADVNNDSSVDLSDAQYILNYYFMGGPAPPSPFPGCDVEPIDEDELPCESSSC